MLCDHSECIVIQGQSLNKVLLVISLNMNVENEPSASEQNRIYRKKVA
jgi:hypothetical protein